MSDTDDDLSTRGGKSRKKLMLMIAFVVLFILGVGGYSAYAYLQNLWPFPAPEEESAVDIAAKLALPLVLIFLISTSASRLHSHSTSQARPSVVTWFRLTRFSLFMAVQMQL